MTDTIPSNADQGSIQAAPTCAAARDGARRVSPLMAGPLSGPWAHVACGGDAVKAFTDMLDTVIAEFPPNHVTQKKNQRVLACAYLSITAVNYEGVWKGQTISPSTYKISGGLDKQTAFLGLCLQVAAAISALEESGAGTASARCSQAQAALPVSLIRVRGRYEATINAPVRPLKRPTALAVSCRRSRVGLKLAITPRRHRTFRQVGMTSLAIAYANGSKTPLAVRTTFKVN